MENSVILEEILEELTENAKHISSSSLEKFANEIIKARHIFVAGAGRSGFVARGFANRLMHLGLEVFSRVFSMVFLITESSPPPM